TTLVEAIYETLRRETQVMVCAQSNMAVDWIAEKLDDRGLSVMRIGNPTRVGDRMLACTYERRFESHPLYNDLWATRRAIKQLYESRNGSSDSRHQKIARLRERATELEMQINESLFSQCNVIACTLTGSANRILVGKTFNTLFIDEAAQALEASCWIAIQRCRRVVLAGDHRQLPPTLKCREAIRGGLDHTLMQTIVEAHPEVVSLLRVQYRMNERIMQFSNQCFYDGLLESAPSVKYRGILDWEEPIEWIETPQSSDNDGDAWTEAFARDGVSRVNPAEAELTVSTLHDYFEKIGRERILAERIDVGIISPYKGQVYLLRHMLKRDPWFKPYRHLITINTVDGFQGQERDIIVISMVRQNEHGEVGFLRDLRRMNVAITRARMKLIVIGNADTLCHNPFYRLLYNYCQQAD
ncbi:MAG: helicase, partial [Bacteroidaceae bacterium]|nr:helicase [Bacteroidaceae bacterium]